MCDEHDATRVKLFCVGQAQEKLLRTSDAAQLHIRWPITNHECGTKQIAHFQLFQW